MRKPRHYAASRPRLYSTRRDIPGVRPRPYIAVFADVAVQLSNLPLRNSNRIPVPDANSLVCGAANALMNIAAP